MRKLLLPFLLISVGLISCKDETEDLSEMAQGQKFFPLEIGKYILYDVDTLYWDDFAGVPIPRSCQVRYEVADTFRDNSGRLSYLIVIQTRGSETDPYRPNDVVYATPTDGRVEYKQKNLTYIKMTFPVNDGKSWDGNAMIPFNNDNDYKEFDNDKWNYTYANFDKEFDPGNNLYEHTVTVNQIDDVLNNPDLDTTAYAYKNYAREIYAYNVGLVYRERIYWEFQPKVGSSGGSGRRKGYEVRMRAVENN